MCSRFLRVAAAALLAAGLAGARDLKVCADPDNLPFSNSRGEGFENKVAEIIARELGAKLEYVWWAQRKSFVKNTLSAGMCDLIVGLPEGYPSVALTRPWYRSAYVFLSRGRPVTSLDDSALRTMRIGIHIVGEDYAPPARELARRGIVNNIVGYSLFGAYGEENPPAKLVHAVACGDVDVAIVWGPTAGYFARRQAAPLTIAPLPTEFAIAAAVRTGNEELRSEVQRALDSRATELRKILESYGVPLCDAPSAHASLQR